MQLFAGDFSCNFESIPSCLRAWLVSLSLGSILRLEMHSASDFNVFPQDCRSVQIMEVMVGMWHTWILMICAELELAVH